MGYGKDLTESSDFKLHGRVVASCQEPASPELARDVLNWLFVLSCGFCGWDGRPESGVRRVGVWRVGFLGV